MEYFEETGPESSLSAPTGNAWCVLMVDDDAEVHTVTRMALRNFEYLGRPLELLSAYSGEEGRRIFEARNDIALAIIDVVMETKTAGLDLVRYVRQKLENHQTRLVMRTGQPGHAPEDTVIREYAIDDYKQKTELTVQKLRTMLYSKLRAYQDICVIVAQRDGLSRILGAIAKVQNSASFPLLATAALEQVTSLLGLDRSALYCMVLPADDHNQREARALAATGAFVQYSTGRSFGDFPDVVAERFHQVIAERKSIHFDDTYVMYAPSDNGNENLLYINHNTKLEKIDRQILEIYTQSWFTF